MVELRKRKAHVQDPSSSPPLKKRNSLPIAVDPEKNVAPEAGDSSFVELVPGDIIDIIGFGGDISIHTGEKTTLKSLLESSQNGVILFTYPKASTPGCESLFLLHLFCVRWGIQHFYLFFRLKSTRYHSSLSIQGRLFVVNNDRVFHIWPI